MNTPARHAAALESPVGTLLAVVDDAGALVALDFEGRVSRWRDLAPAGRLVQPVRDELARYFAGELRAFSLALAPEGTPFQRRVWGELVRIPYGRTISDSELARRLGSPRAVRAVGRANGANPIAIVVPCHRVIGADGTLTGYGGGLERKRALLALETRVSGRPIQLALA
jgi:methylated-DNA-[protein]-cysteine S-methyltransferase